MPGDLSIGGGVYIYIPTAIDYWPVTGVTQPQHYWPFKETGDYTDHGSVGGKTLAPEGTGNSFGAEGLVLNGSGWASVATSDAYVTDIGDTFSMIFEGSYSVFPSNYGMFGMWGGGTSGWLWYSQGAEPCVIDLVTYDSGGRHDATPTFALLETGVFYQFVVTLGGGYINLYKNATLSSSCPYSWSYPPAAAPAGASMSMFNYASTLWNGTCRRAGILKGTAWSADDVAAIYSALT